MSEPIWTAENMNRKEGDTTFKQCGWCEHRGCGSYRYDAMIEGSCSLLKDYDDKVKYNTPCKIVNLGKKDLLDIVKSKNYEISSHNQGIKSLKSEIKILKKLSSKAENIPPLPDARDCNHFALKKRVWVFFDAPQGTKIPNAGWYVGTVVNGYRSGDGCVSYVLDDLPESKGGWGCGYCVPTVLMDEEYKYFKKNPKKFRSWLEMSDKNYNGHRIDIDRMINLMK